MAKKNEMNAMNAEAQEAPMTPNRDTYSQMWSEDNSDIDFEDKEARYGRAIDDRNELRERRNADSALGGLFENHNWLALMYSELKDNPDIDPFEWLAGFCQEQDITLDEVMNNPEARKRLTAKMNEHQKKQAEGKAAAQEKDTNLQKSLDELQALQEETGLDDEECLKMWGDFWQMIDSAQKGLVSKDTWQAFSHSRTYDADVKSAAERGGMQARNEKIQNQIRRPSEESAGMPPTLEQGSGGNGRSRKMPREESLLDGLNDY